MACSLGRKGVVGKRLGILLKVTEFERVLMDVKGSCYFNFGFNWQFALPWGWPLLSFVRGAMVPLNH